MLSLTVETRSWMHALPVPLKLGILALTTLFMLSVSDWWWSLLAVFAVAALYLSAEWEFARMGASRLKPLAYLVVILLIYHIVTARLEQGLVICFNLLATVSLANLVTMTSRLDDMMAVVEWLVRPLRHMGLPPRALGFAMGLVIRFTPIFLQKGMLLSQAWRARSQKRTSPRLLVPLALGALDDAERVADALRARGGLHEPQHKVSPFLNTDEQQSGD